MAGRRHPRVAGLAALGLVLATTACLPGIHVSGTTVAVPATIDATGATDVTTRLAAFLAGVPDGSTVVFRSGGRYRMDGSFVVAGRRDLTFAGNRATLVAGTPGDLSRRSVLVEGSSGITFTDLTVRGANPYGGVDPRAYVPEKAGQHGFDIRSSSRVLLDRVTVSDTYGDFVYIGKSEHGGWSDGVTVRNSRFARSGRQGIALTAARNVVVRGNQIDQIKRAAFDLEPVAAGFGVTDVTIADNVIGAGTLRFVAAVSYGPADRITVQGNRLPDRPLAIEVRELNGRTRYGWKILGNTGGTVYSATAGTVMTFTGVDGLVVQGNTQAFAAGRGMVGAIAYGSCRAVFTGNTFPGAVAEGRVEGSC